VISIEEFTNHLVEVEKHRLVRNSIDVDQVFLGSKVLMNREVVSECFLSRHELIQNAAQRPNINLICKSSFPSDEFWCPITTSTSGITGSHSVVRCPW